ncbi:MAG: hypothetical protein KGH95_02425, partial [Thaumarchaeota archaeon]|nr:hypothetical protein [Nitrososphaerota archaeon]
KNLAIQEQQTANQISDTKSTNALPILPLIIAGVIGAGAIGFVVMKKSRSNKSIMLKETQSDDTIPEKETIYRLKPELRQDDKEIIAFISEKGGQVYESELRKKFLMPRTTMWRAVKRLEREDVVEIEKVDQQNLIKLRKMEDQK